jgi:hypothetical protein
LWTNYYLSQTIPEGTKHIQNIDAVTFENGDTLKSIRTKTYYDSTWHIITYNNTSSSSTPKGTRTVRVIDTPKKKQDSNISQNGDTTSSYVYIYDESGNRIEYYQIEKHDTINKEKRTYDEHNNELTLWKYGESDYYLKYINEYDDSNNVIKRLYYNENGRNIETEITKRDYKKGTIKTYSKKPESPIIQTSDVLIKDGILISKHLKASEAINYGIYLIRELGGYTETKKNGKDLVWMKIYNSKSELTTSINVTYQEYP